MFALIGWMLAGIIIGGIAKMIMPGRDPGGLLVTMVIGIVGAILGGTIGRGLGFYGPQQGAGWIMSIVGAIVLLAIYRMVAGRRAV
jgi:uncharacterized membrane protein YeaQ/YmgE (transglycosylase-associated protein family)